MEGSMIDLSKYRFQSANEDFGNSIFAYEGW